MSDYKCLLAEGPDSENSHDLLPKLMEPQTGLISPFRHQPHFQGAWRWGEFRARSRAPRGAAREGIWPGIPVRSRRGRPCLLKNLRGGTQTSPLPSQNRRQGLRQKQQTTQLMGHCHHLLLSQPANSHPSFRRQLWCQLLQEGSSDTLCPAGGHSPFPAQHAVILAAPATY